MNILFRADASSTIGTGHIMRDLVLAKQYPKANITFATQDLDGNINHKVIEAGYKLEILKSNSTKELYKLIKELRIDLLVIDHYGIDAEQEKQLKIKNPTLKILNFDDTYEKHYCNILLNPNIGANKKRYKDLVPKDCELRCGSKYILLRDEFFQKFPKKIQSDKINILIAMGGVDSRDLNIGILEVLKNFNNFHIDIITTSANQNLNKLQEYVLNKDYITLNINSNEVAKLMHKSDFAILTPSVTINEAFYMKLPFIAIKTENNQQDMYNYLKKNNFLVLDKFDSLLLYKKIKLMIDKLNSRLINFTQLSLDEKKMVLKWRNDENIRRWMHNRNKIKLENHLQYIETLNAKKDRVYFLLKNGNNPIGVVDLTEIQIDKSAELGIYTNPELKGYGTLLMSKIIEYAFEDLNIKVLKANVYRDNLRAIKLYEKFNFKTIALAEDKNGKLQNMEFKNGNS